MVPRVNSAAMEIDVESVVGIVAGPVVHTTIGDKFQKRRKAAIVVNS